jgi:hypothetical protein
MDRTVRRVLTTLLLALMADPAVGRACDVPVYRYALEHWIPDPYRVVILHQGPMDAAARTIADNLEKQSGQSLHGNFIVETIDADHPLTPQVVVYFPAASQVHGVAWQGRLDADALAAIADSPCRHDIAHRLLSGDAVVWVLLQTGRKEADNAAARRIDDELENWRAGLRDRPESASRVASAPGAPPLTCSLVRVSRNDPAEKLLVETLLSVEPDLRGRDEPMAFPVFGRGRVLYALVGAGINAETVGHALDFLVDGCSCTVKRQNPGVDLLLNADWSVITPTTPEEPATAPTSSGDLVPLTPLPAALATTTTPTAAAPATGPNPWLIAGAIAAAVLVLATGATAFRSSRRSRHS